jgi:hypothetical protein
MSYRNVLTASCLSCLLVACDCPKCPETITKTDPIPCTPNPVTDPQGDVTAGNYCVCNAGDHDKSGYKKPHLAVGESVIIPEVDLVTQVQLGAYQVPMIRSMNKQELSALVNLPHERTAGGSETATHLQYISPATVTLDPNTNEPSIEGCVVGKNTLKVSFCFKEAGKWACKPPVGDYGDTHVQN